MPTPAPTSTAGTLAQLQALGARLRAQRHGLGVSSTAAAAAAGVSRVTLHRIEKGEPSVTMGAYLNVMEALGLALLVGADATPVMTGPEAGPLERSVRPESTEPQAAPNEIPLDSYPELRRLAWQVAGAQTLTAQEALAVYERNWRHLDTAALQASERQLIDDLARQHGRGRLLV
ncbi:MAG TPA: helix-turn-helix domain-containing protein [Burkholderiaceae bacterium]|nr:helix-turn-helix domain-containing protein [Burkholderiaceae bacterium]